MRRTVLGMYIEVTSEEEALHALLVGRGNYVPFLGAGVSREAGVLTANEICDDIRTILEVPRADREDSWADEYLNWQDASRRYGTCLERYGSAEDRVKYFRDLLLGRRPAFAHHATALLMARGLLYRNALTTNFDKLLEQAFNEQNIRECQAIRMSKEAEFWGPERDKCYLLKLHGDYDTHNILNTRAETRAIPSFFRDLSEIILRGRGMLVLGSAGNEPSIVDYLARVLAVKKKRVLSRGVRWGVYVGRNKPVDIDAADEIAAVVSAIKEGAVNRKLVELLTDMNQKYGDRRPCSFFPVWGSSNFLYRLIEGTGDAALQEESAVLLDHDMRLTALFRRRGLTSEAVERHLDRLSKAQNRLSRREATLDLPVRPITDYHVGGSVRVDLVYGDITAGNVGLADRRKDVVRAVFSPEDTNLSAGGGVALALLNKAGARTLLNELGKHSPVEHGRSVVTSAGHLPLHYIIHAAVLDVSSDGGYIVTSDVVEAAVTDGLRKAEALGVNDAVLPLLGAGTAGLSPMDSLMAILRSISAVGPAGSLHSVTVVIFDEASLGSTEVLRAVRSFAPADEP